MADSSDKAAPATDNTQHAQNAQHTQPQAPQSAQHASAPVDSKAAAVPSDMSNVLKHIQDLEKNNGDLKKELDELRERNGRLSQKTREGMQSALDTLMKKWMDSCETKDEKVKEDFKCGLEKLVKNSAEDNGVWQMMVSASALHQRQEHDLEKLRTENSDLRTRVNGLYGYESSRTVGEKSKADSELSRADVDDGLPTGNIWDAFARDIGQSHF